MKFMLPIEHLEACVVTVVKSDFFQHVDVPGGDEQNRVEQFVVGHKLEKLGFGVAFRRALGSKVDESPNESVLGVTVAGFRGPVPE